MSSAHSLDLRVDSSVHRYLARIPKKDAARIGRVIAVLALDPYVGDIEKMKGEENVGHVLEPVSKTLPLDVF